MTPPSSPDFLHSRRGFLKTTSTAVAASALAGVSIPFVHAAGSDLVQLALVGCGGRGTGAAANALGTTNLGPIKLVAMADVFETKQKASYEALKAKSGDQVDVTADTQVHRLRRL